MKSVKEKRQARITTSGTRPASLIHPGIHKSYPAVFEIACIARGKDCTMDMGNRGNLRVKFSYGPSSLTPGRRNLCKLTRRHLIEFKDPAAEILAKCSFRLGVQSVASFARRKKFHAIK